MANSQVETSVVEYEAESDLRTLRTNDIYDSAQRHLKKVQTSITYAFAMGRKEIDKGKLKKAIASADLHAIDKVVASVPQAIHLALESTLFKPLMACFTDGGEVGAMLLTRQLRALQQQNSYSSDITFRDLGKKDLLNFHFNAHAKESALWVKEHALELAKGLSATSIQDIAEALVDAFEDGDLSTLYDEVFLAVGDAARAEMIAKNEIMRASNAGHRASWNQAVEQGYLEEDAIKEWIITQGFACAFCEVLDGATTTITGTYPDEGGDGPPLHVGCRCTEGISAKSLKV